MESDPIENNHTEALPTTKWSGLSRGIKGSGHQDQDPALDLVVASPVWWRLLDGIEEDVKEIIKNPHRFSPSHLVPKEAFDWCPNSYNQNPNRRHVGGIALFEEIHKTSMRVATNTTHTKLNDPDTPNRLSATKGILIRQNLEGLSAKAFYAELLTMEIEGKKFYLPDLKENELKEVSQSLLEGRRNTPLGIQRIADIIQAMEADDEQETVRTKTLRDDVRQRMKGNFDSYLLNFNRRDQIDKLYRREARPDPFDQDTIQQRVVAVLKVVSSLPDEGAPISPQELRTLLKWCEKIMRDPNLSSATHLLGLNSSKDEQLIKDHEWDNFWKYVITELVARERRFRRSQTEATTWEEIEIQLSDEDIDFLEKAFDAGFTVDVEMCLDGEIYFRTGPSPLAYYSDTRSKKSWEEYNPYEPAEPPLPYERPTASKFAEEWNASIGGYYTTPTDRREFRPSGGYLHIELTYKGGRKSIRKHSNKSKGIPKKDTPIEEAAALPTHLRNTLNASETHDVIKLYKRTKQMLGVALDTGGIPLRHSRSRENPYCAPAQGKALELGGISQHLRYGDAEYPTEKQLLQIIKDARLAVDLASTNLLYAIVPTTAVHRVSALLSARKVGITPIEGEGAQLLESIRRRFNVPREQDTDTRSHAQNFIARQLRALAGRNYFNELSNEPFDRKFLYPRIEGWTFLAAKKHILNLQSGPIAPQIPPSLRGKGPSAIETSFLFLTNDGVKGDYVWDATRAKDLDPQLALANATDTDIHLDLSGGYGFPTLILQEGVKKTVTFLEVIKRIPISTAGIPYPIFDWKNSH